MLIADTSALISLATADTLQLVLEEFEVHTAETVIEELETTAGFKIWSQMSFNHARVYDTF